jgi:hypothetical protein
LIAFFIHMLGVVNLVGGFILSTQAGTFYRRATTWEAARSFLTMLQIAPGMLIAGAILLLLSGSYMASTRWGMNAPWVTVGMAAALLALAVAIFVLVPGMRRLRKLTEGKEGPILPQDRPALVTSNIWSWGAVTNGVTLSVAWNMVMKPGWPVSIALPIVLGFVGWLVSFLLARAARRKN